MGQLHWWKQLPGKCTVLHLERNHANIQRLHIFLGHKLPFFHLQLSWFLKQRKAPQILQGVQLIIAGLIKTGKYVSIKI